MEILIFSDKKNIRTCFEKIIKSKKYSIEFCSIDDFSSRITKSGTGNLIYLDISSVKETDKKKLLTQILRLNNSRTGIIDTDNSITDIANLFHQGAADYIGKELFKTGITIKRIESICSFREIGSQIPEPGEKTDDDRLKNYILSGNDWTLVQPDKEYTFCFMFVELDNFREMKKTAGAERTKKIMEAFHKFIGNYVSSINGRIWMWMEYTGLILIPFDGTKCDAILSAFKLMLNRPLINSIDLTMDYSYSYHIVLHAGNTVYRERGETGTIVSDSINSIFHLGQKYAENQNMYITDELERFIPPGIRDLFISAGEFEGRKILRMKQII